MYISSMWNELAVPKPTLLLYLIYKILVVEHYHRKVSFHEWNCINNRVRNRVLFILILNEIFYTRNNRKIRLSCLQNKIPTPSISQKVKPLFIVGFHFNLLPLHSTFFYFFICVLVVYVVSVDYHFTLFRRYHSYDTLN